MAAIVSHKLERSRSNVSELGIGKLGVLTIISGGVSAAGTVKSSVAGCEEIRLSASAPAIVLTDGV
jgi:hypothetical protein